MKKADAKMLIEAVLSSFDFVRWDRYTVVPDGKKDKQFNFYGWIDREKDAYKDFLLISFWTMNHQWWYCTSSAKYDDDIKRILGEDDDGASCIRIEKDFDIPNSIKLI